MKINFLKKKVKILNYYINPIKLSNLINLITNWIDKKKRKYICVSNVHSCIESYNNKKFKIAHNSSDLAIPDGRPIFWALKLLGNKHTEHLPGYFVTEKLCELSNNKKINIGFYGSTDENLKKLTKNFKKKTKKNVLLLSTLRKDALMKVKAKLINYVS